MEHRISPSTLNGQHMVAIAEELAAEFAPSAAEHDRDATYAFEHIYKLRDSKYLYGPFPKEVGGLGVEKVHDVAVAASRLAEGDPSTTIGASMHLIGAMGLARLHSTAVAAGKKTAAEQSWEAMRRIVCRGDIIASAVSELNQDLTRPGTTASRAEGGWIINGRKIFGTMGPAATMFNVGVTYTTDSGEERYAYAQVRADARGLVVNNDWDALGMRASGSGSIVFHQVPIGTSALGKGFKAGEISAELLESFLMSGSMHAASALGIAEAAMAHIKKVAAKRAPGSHGSTMADRPVNQLLAADMVVDLVAMRGALSRTTAAIDTYYEDYPSSRGPREAVQAVLVDAQAAKLFINQAAQRVVDKALTVSGGAGFMSGNPLSKMYRDVRAGAFMHPFGSTIAATFVGQDALGAEITLR